MNLLGKSEWHTGESQRICRFAVDRPETAKSRLSIRRDVDAWAALNKRRCEGTARRRAREKIPPDTLAGRGR